MKEFKEKGFTLIEVLLVVLILSILTIIAVPNFIAARKKARAKVCVSSLRQIDWSLEQWAMDYNKTNGDTATWNELVPRYIRTIPQCPAGGTYQTSGAEKDIFILGDTVTCSIGIDNPLLEWDDHVY